MAHHFLIKLIHGLDWPKAFSIEYHCDLLERVSDYTKVFLPVQDLFTYRIKLPVPKEASK